MSLRGSMVAIVTPFRQDRIDEDALRRLIEMQIERGTSAIVPCGTTGESATLSHEEHDRVIELTVEAVRGRTSVIAGTGSNNTREAVRLTRHAREAGADAALLITPYYNKPTQEGLYRHFRAVAEAVELPLVLYNIPGRTAVNMAPETFGRLVRDCPTIVAVKEASGDLAQMRRMLDQTEGTLTLISGDDALTVDVLELGGTGVISVLANLVPQDVADMVRAFESGDRAGARRMQERLLPLTNALFLETNPIPVKTAMARLGWIEPELRLPLCPMSEANAARLEAAMDAYGLAGGAAHGSRGGPAARPTGR
ncbi:MAG TPA: 4-hydroxy-tetrahydrodipicolinate synthase [bacterium]